MQALRRLPLHVKTRWPREMFRAASSTKPPPLPPLPPLPPRAPSKDAIPLPEVSWRGVSLKTAKRAIPQKPLELEIRLTERLPIRELARLTGCKLNDLIKALFLLGEEPRTVSSFVHPETAELCFEEMKSRGWITKMPKFLHEVPAATKTTRKFTKTRIAADIDAGFEYPSRPPIAAIIGHVDHGKTTLLDALRRTSVVNHEAGGITQSIGAFSVNLDGKQMTVLDTPGHEAFVEMRKRGANATDIAVLVIAADDGIMPQTIEAIKHIQAAAVPLVVALNKCDRAGARPDKVHDQLLHYGIHTEQRGGDVLAAEISALKAFNNPADGNLKALVESIHLQADIMQLVAPVSVNAEGVILEARHDKHRGPMASVLLTAGTLKQGDAFVAGTAWGRVRRMFSNGLETNKVGPSGAVEVMGLRDFPSAGDEFIVVPTEERAKELAELRLASLVAHDDAKRRRAAARQYEATKMGTTIMNVVVKSDVQGSLEAVVAAMEKAHEPSQEVMVQVVHSGVGEITAADVSRAQAAKATIFGFNSKPVGVDVVNQARIAQVPIATFSIIYALVENVKSKLVDLLPEILEDRMTCEAEVAQLFPLKGKRSATVGTIAGVRMNEGTMKKESLVRVVRGEEQLWEGRIDTMKHMKENVTKLIKGAEGGLALAGFHDLKQGDRIVGYEMFPKKRSLTDPPLKKAPAAAPVVQSESSE